MKIESNKIILIILFLALVLVVATCSDHLTPTLPPKSDSTSHEITWEVDTLGDWNSRLSAIWGAAPNDIWAAGWIVRDDWGTNLIHYNGEKWVDFTYFEAELRSIHGISSNDIWAVGNNLIIPNRNALIAHYNGVEWKSIYTNIDLPSLKAIWASSANSVFAVGSKGTILHFDGRNWEIMQSNTDKTLYDVWGFGSDDVYACGGDNPLFSEASKPLLLHHDGKTWSSLLDTINNPNKVIETVWGSSPENIYFQGYYIENGLYQGSLSKSWSFVQIPDDNNDINKIRGNSTYNIFVVGAYGIVVHYNGQSWQMYSELLKEPGGPTLSDVLVFDNDVFIVGTEHNIMKGIIYRGKIKN